MSESDLQRLRSEYDRRQDRSELSRRYSPLNWTQLYLLQQRQRETVKLLADLGLTSLANKHILELGAGSGGVLLEYLSYGATARRLHGVDLLESRLREAQTRVATPLICADGQQLPYSAETFDVVMQYTAFSSVLDAGVKAAMAREMLRVVQKRSGVIIWYDFWFNPLNAQTKGIGIAEIKSLFPSCRLSIRRMTLAPPIVRRLVRLSWTACQLLEKFRLFNTHFLVAIQPTATSSEVNAGAVQSDNRQEYAPDEIRNTVP
jgi:ubiquinone/menaquinone biosynthesis C-methylase UbiE